MNNKIKLHWILYLESIFLDIIYKITCILKTKKYMQDITVIKEDAFILKKNAHDYYQELISKYPEFMWVEKYIDANLELAVHPIVALHMVHTRGFHFLLTDEATINDIIILLSMGLSVTADIKILHGNSHSIEIEAFSKVRKEFYFKDSLGNYNMKYKLTAHSYCFISYDNFTKICCGNSISILIMLKDKESLINIRNIIMRNKKCYIF
jgi:hypothetical protein